MLIPAIFYGHYPEVQKRVRKAANKIAKGESLEVVLMADGMLDTAITPGFIYFEPVEKSYDLEPGFHTFPLCRILKDLFHDKKISDELEESIYHNLIKINWGILMLIGRYSAQAWLKKPGRFVSFTRAAIQIQDEFKDIGKRYQPISFVGDSFWGIPHGLFYAMANVGFSMDEINRYREQQKIPQSILESPLLNS